jgi:hypothetical protein
MQNKDKSWTYLNKTEKFFVGTATNTNKDYIQQT